jgi:membrane protease YdiL (CAAX protease family)
MSLAGKDADFEQRGDAPFRFFALVAALSLPFWSVSAVVDRELMPGLPLAGLMVVCPGLAAVVMRVRQSGGQGTTALLARALDVQRLRSPLVIVPLLLIHPGLFAASYAIQKSLGEHLPAPDIALLPTLGLFGVFLIAGVCEELGWTGYALEPLQRR